MSYNPYKTFENLIKIACKICYDDFRTMCMDIMPNNFTIGRDCSDSPLLNALLISRYPFLKITIFFDDEFINNPNKFPESTILNSIPDGWRKTIGLEFCEDIRNALLSSQNKNAITEYCVDQVKEKFGSLRWYDHGYPDDVIDDILHLNLLYELVTKKTCIECGSMHDVRVNKCGWIYPLCYQCFEEIKISKEEKLKNEDIKKKFNDQFNSPAKFSTEKPIELTSFSKSGKKVSNLSEKYLFNSKWEIGKIFIRMEKENM